MTQHPTPGVMEPAALDPTHDVVDLTVALVDIASESRQERRIADAVEAAMRGLGHLEVTRLGHTVVARTHLDRAERVVVAGHLDTVPENGNLPCRREQTADGELLHGLGTCDMKGGDAVILRLAAGVPEPNRDVTYVLYEAEEIEEEHNGLKRVVEQRPDLLEADFAILMEPSNAVVEAGCQGTLRVAVTTTGERAHSARWWRGSNAIHGAAGVLATLAAYEPRRVEIDGLEYREGLNAVRIAGGVAGNVLPDACTVEVNFRFAPDRSTDDALAHVRGVFAGHELEVTDLAPAALPGLDRPAARAFVDAVGGEVHPKFGWTDVARFTGLGVPAVNYGPGDPLYAHKADEFVRADEVRRCEAQLRTWLGASAEDRA